MKLLRLCLAVCLVVVSGAGAPSSAQTLFAVASQEGSVAPRESARGAAKDALIGTWDLVLTFGDESQVKSVLTVMSRRHEGEGSILHAAEASLLLPNPTTPEQGAWAHVAHRQFVASYFGFAVDSGFTAPAGRIGFRQHQIAIGANGETCARPPREIVAPTGRPGRW